MNRSRAPLILLVIVCLVLATLARGLHNRVIRTGASTSAGTTAESLGSLDSYTLGLLLGGLRGPLVMTLWVSSENAKNDRQLDDVDTKINLIGLLQPEFDTVHLFQIWNKAYNLSVQMINKPSKYSVILSGIDYGIAIREARPENINLESQIGSIFFDKLGNPPDAEEKKYYRTRLREDSLQPSPMRIITLDVARKQQFIDAARAAGLDDSRYTLRTEGKGLKTSCLLRRDIADRVLRQLVALDVPHEIRDLPAPEPQVRRAGERRSNFDTLLDENFRLLPHWAVRDRGADDAQWVESDRKHDLSYLVRFEPYPYGVSPFAVGSTSGPSPCRPAKNSATLKWPSASPARDRRWPCTTGPRKNSTGRAASKRRCSEWSSKTARKPKTSSSSPPASPPSRSPRRVEHRARPCWASTRPAPPPHPRPAALQTLRWPRRFTATSAASN
jgi:hypothetical protein